MNRYIRTLAIIVATSPLALGGVANGQRAAMEGETPHVTWKDAPPTIVRDSSASAGAKVVKDAETGRLRAARAGELPETTPRVPTQIINYPNGSAIAIVGDDLMVDSIAVKQPDGSVKIGHEATAGTPAEVK
jgi:hypothetical protein